MNWHSPDLAQPYSKDKKVILKAAHFYDIYL